MPLRLQLAAQKAPPRSPARPPSDAVPSAVATLSRHCPLVVSFRALPRLRSVWYLFPSVIL